MAKQQDIQKFIGEMFSFNSALKLYHWHVTGPGSYAQHIAIDQALDELLDKIDSISETAYALSGNLNIVIPETSRPQNIVKFIEEFYTYVNDYGRSVLGESFQLALLDDYTETLQQLLFRLKRLE